MALPPVGVGGVGALAAPVRPPDFGTPPGALNLASFLSWPIADQVDYVNLNGAGSPPQVTIGPLGTQQVIASVPVGGFALDMVYVPPNFYTAPASLASSEFLDWNADQQRAYLRSRGGAATIGPAGTPQVTGTVAGAGFTLNFQAPATAPTALTPGEFLSWHPGHQLDYVNDNGTGAPKSVLIGLSAGAKVMARVDPSVSAVIVTSLPADFNKSPAALDANVFLKWRSDEQLAYVQANGGGALTIGAPGGSQVNVAPSGDTVILSGFTAQTVAPGSLATATFLNWDSRLQAAYLNANGVGDPKGIEIGIGHPKILTYLPSGATTVEVAYPPADFAKAPAALDADTFLRFSPRLQLAYARVHGPAAVTVGASGNPQVTATVNAGALGVTLSYSAPSTAPTALDPLVFLSWPAGIRLDYVNDKGTIVAPATTKSVTIGRPTDRALTATMNAAGTALVIDTFWATQAQSPPDSVIDATATIPPIPYHYLAGSDVGIEALLNNQTAEAKFATYDGVINKLPNRPPPAGASYTPDEFLELHSAHQLEVLKASATTVAVTGGTRKMLTLPAGATPGATGSITIVEGDRDDRLYIVEHLQKRDFAVMSKVDQEAVAATGGAFTKKATEYSLTSSRDLILNGDTFAGSPTQLGILDIIAVINDPTSGLFPDSLSTKGLMSKADRDVFIQELNAIRNRVDNTMAVFSASDILKQCNDVLTRFKRAEAFATVPAEGRPPQNTIEFVRVASLDQNKTIEAGYRKFIEQEKRLLSLENARLEIANTGATQNKKLDAPNLVFLFQLYSNLTTEAKVSAETEEVSQQNGLLKVYSEMQRLVNVTKQSFKETDSKKAQEEKQGILGKSGPLPGGLTDTEMRTIAMFEDYLAGSQYGVTSAFPQGHLALHPIEELRGITRPATHEFFGNNSAAPTFSPQLRTWWDSVATQLSDTVSLINQESQIKMNDINSMDKQKNRHFDLANSALQKMNEMLQNIARAGG